MRQNYSDQNSHQIRTRINEQIRCSQILVIKDDQKLGVMHPEDARRIAREASLDLVEIAPQSRPPVCKIMDYGKFKYELSVKAKEQNKKQKSSENKELRLSPSIGDHDLMVKINSAKKFLSDGHKVLFRLKYKNRQNAHKDLGFQVVDKIVQGLEGSGKMESKPRLEGTFLVCIFDPEK